MTMMLVPAVLLWACDHPHASTWTAERALAPIVQRHDADGDGRLSSAEWTAVSQGRPPLEHVDIDGDGMLGPAEIHTLVEGIDPVSYETGRHQRTTPHPGDNEIIFPTTWPARSLRDLLRFLRAELPAERADLPPEMEISAASASGELTAPAVRALLVRLAAAYEAEGLSWPERLPSEPPPSEPPPSEPLPPEPLPSEPLPSEPPPSGD